ncbi:MAG: hypothetical protein D6737_16735 [Chloroflexi bacterium]|nr:MAG: hypothetical protein CUN54_04630 [Phototrophicales bacterium]RMF77763.1 MAG: hypothetical protein D6737_16735 [Chloroflexota bacterium]
MTTLVQERRRRKKRQPRSQRFINYWRNLFVSGELTSLLVVYAMLMMPVLALQVTGWPVALRTVVPVLTVSTLLGFLLARSGLNELLALIISSGYGFGFIIVVAAINEPGGIFNGFSSLFTKVRDWVIAATGSGVNTEDLIFTLLVALLAWYLGYNSTWHVFRVDRIWRVVLPPGLILVTNSIYYTGNANLDIYLIVFLFMALMLVARSHLEARQWNWYVNGIRTPLKLRRQFMRMGAALALVALLIAWGAPSGDLQDRLDRFQEFLQNDPLTRLGETWSRLFTTVDARGPTTADYYGADSLQLGGAIQLGEQVVMTIDAPQGRRYYWRSRVFDTYENGRWSPAADTRLSDPEAPLEIIHPQYLPGARVPIQQEFTILLNASRLVYTAPQPLSVDLATRTDLRYAGESDEMNVSVIRPMEVIRRGEKYTTTSLVSNATADQLRAADTNYPAWVTQTYLQVSPSITQRTIQLGQQIVDEAGAVTVYDKAKAIERWLRTNIEYNEQIPQPPRDRDPVDWVLFDLQQGYCNYYATSMIAMLRSMGIPSRMAAGFAQGNWDPNVQQFVVEERDAHTWVEVYFPGYGWIEFEPTAAQAPLNRTGDTDAPPQQQGTPIASPTPTATLTPSPTPTQVQPTPLPEQQQNNQEAATPTFTPSPTPTATPVIVPTQPPPITPQRTDNPLSVILPAIGLALLALLAVVLIIGIIIFLWWWWEWRGMKGLSPITRAYARLERYLGLIGIHLTPQQTPEERRRHVIKDLPVAEPPVTAITRMYMQERYGPGAEHPMQSQANANIADEAWSDARNNILRRFFSRFVPFLRRRK